ncbi:MAG: hypothetical protein ABW202_02120 [Duganella sp.]
MNKLVGYIALACSLVLAVPGHAAQSSPSLNCNIAAMPGDIRVIGDVHGPLPRMLMSPPRIGETYTGCAFTAMLGDDEARLMHVVRFENGKLMESHTYAGMEELDNSYCTFLPRRKGDDESCARAEKFWGDVLQFQDKLPPFGSGK